MPSARNMHLLDILYQALQSPLGLVVACSDAQLAQVSLTRVRASDPNLAPISIRFSRENPKELWLIKTGQVLLPKVEV